MKARQVQPAPGSTKTGHIPKQELLSQLKLERPTVGAGSRVLRNSGTQWEDFVDHFQVGSAVSL